MTAKQYSVFILQLGDIDAAEAKILHDLACAQSEITDATVITKLPAAVEPLLQDYCESAVFVCAPFSGAAYAQLEKADCRVVGPSVLRDGFLSQVLVASETFEAGGSSDNSSRDISCGGGGRGVPRRIFVALLSGAHVLLSGLAADENEAERTRLAWIVRSLGGRVCERLSESTTHVVATVVTPDVQAIRQRKRLRQADSHGADENIASTTTSSSAATARSTTTAATTKSATVMQLLDRRPAWLHELWSKASKGVIGARGFDIVLREHRIPVLAGAVVAVCPEGIAPRLAARLRQAAASLGAECQTEATEGCTHYVGNIISEQAAPPAGAIAVIARWIFDCFRQQQWLDEAAYWAHEAPQTPISTPTVTPAATPQRAPVAATPAVAAARSPSVVPSAKRQRIVGTGSCKELSSTSSPLRMSSSATKSTNEVSSTTSCTTTSTVTTTTTTTTTTSPVPFPRRRKRAITVPVSKDSPLGAAALVAAAASTPNIASPLATKSSSKRKRRASLDENSIKEGEEAQPTADLAPLPFTLMAGLQAGARVSKREMRIRELLEKEEHTLEKLETVVSLFQRPLQRDPTLLAASAVHQIFLNADALCELQHSVISALRARVQAYDEATTCISDVYMPLLAQMTQEYKVYITGHDMGKAVLDRALRASKRLTAFVEEQQHDPRCGRQLLPALLMAPVQHIARYTLMFKDVTKTTASSHPDSAPLANLLAHMQELMRTLDAEKRRQEEYAELQAALQEIEDIPDEYLGPGARDRRLVGRLEIRQLGERHHKAGAIFLLNDALILTQRRAVHRQKVDSWMGMGRGAARPQLRYRCQLHRGLDSVCVSDPDNWTRAQQDELGFEIGEHPHGSVIHIGVVRSGSSGNTTALTGSGLHVRHGPASKFVLSLFVLAPEPALKHKFLKKARGAVRAFSGSLPQEMEDDGALEGALPEAVTHIRSGTGGAAASAASIAVIDAGNTDSVAMVTATTSHVPNITVTVTETGSSTNSHHSHHYHHYLHHRHVGDGPVVARAGPGGSPRPSPHRRVPQKAAALGETGATAAGREEESAPTRSPGRSSILPSLKTTTGAGSSLSSSSLSSLSALDKSLSRSALNISIASRRLGKDFKRVASRLGRRAGKMSKHVARGAKKTLQSVGNKLDALREEK